MKYKVRLPPKGDCLRNDDGDTWFIGDTAEEAHEFFADEMCDPVEWVHPVILSAHVLYKRDIDTEEYHDGAEPGDTSFEIAIEWDTARLLVHELKPHQLLAWITGTPRPFWTYGFARSTAGWGPGYMGKVGTDILGEDFPTIDAAQEAVELEVAKRIDAWKAAHPEFHREVPVDA